MKTFECPACGRNAAYVVALDYPVRPPRIMYKRWRCASCESVGSQETPFDNFRGPGVIRLDQTDLTTVARWKRAAYLL